MLYALSPRLIRIIAAGCSACLMVAAIVGLGNTPAAQQGAGAANDQDAARDLLRGPTVADDGLITIDFQGNFIPVRSRPEEAAMALLGLDMDRSEQARMLSNNWILKLSNFLIDQLELLKEASDAIRADDQPRAQQMYQQMFHASDASRSRDPLFDAFAQILNAAEQAKLRTLIDAYWEAWIEWELRNVPDKSPQARAAIQQRLSFLLFQQELQQAFAIALQSHSQRLERIYAVVKPTDEQRSAIREIVLQYVRDTRRTPSEQQQGDVTRAIFKLLDESQRESLLEYVLWQNSLTV